MRRVYSILLALSAILFSFTPAFAQTTAEVERKLADLDKAAKAAQSAGDNAWMLVSAALVLMMTGPGLGAVLRRVGAPQERAGHHDAQLHPDGGGDGALGGGRLQPGVRRRHAVSSAACNYAVPEQRGRGAQCRLRRDHSAADVHDLSVDVRHHHAGADLRRLCRAHEIQRRCCCSRRCGC